MAEKPVAWLGSALADLRSFPKEARQEAGFALDRIQRGGLPPDWKPMPEVGPGVNEIRVRSEGQYRVLYVAKFAEAVYVLHAFRKKSRQTARRDIDIGRRRYAMIRRGRG
ncbi:MAG: type II toxin-antitoxin system RelE/ParE family toxin [Gemmatimonadaceae bacterium]